MAYEGIGRNDVHGDEGNLVSAAPHGDFLVEASLVDGNNADLIDAEEIKAPSPGAKRRRRVILMLVILGALIAGVLFGVLLNRNGDDGAAAGTVVIVNNSFAPTTAPSMAPSFPRGSQENIDRLTALLPDYTVEATEQDPVGPQVRALYWLTLDEAFESYEDAILLERYAMAVFFFATGGPDWSIRSDWLDSTTDHCDWYDKSVRFGLQPCMNGRRTALALTKNNLKGIIPLEIGLLTDLEVLTLTDNRVAGYIPSQIGLLTNLREFSLANNTFGGPPEASRGTIPTELGLLRELSFLELNVFELKGTVPTEIGNLENLAGLILSENNLIGPFPDVLLNLTKLKFLDLGGNQLSGPISRDQLAFLGQFDALSVYNNRFTGQLPDDIGKILPGFTLDFLLGDNLFSGTIPSSLALLSQVEWFDLSNNMFTGTIPANLTAELVSVYGNSFTGSAPESLCEADSTVVYDCGGIFSCTCSGCVCF